MKKDSNQQNILAPERGQKVNSLVLKEHSTEKSSKILEKNGGKVFLVPVWANKNLLKESIRKHFALTPRKINLIKMSGKSVSVKGRAGKTPGFKKAIVFLKPTQVWPSAK